LEIISGNLFGIDRVRSLFSKRQCSTVSGFAGTAGWTGILVCTLIMGALVKTIGYNPFFIFLSVLDLIGALILWTFVRKPSVNGTSTKPQPNPATAHSIP